MINFLLWLIFALFGGMVAISIWINIEIGKPHVIEERQYKSEYWGNKKKRNKSISMNKAEIFIRSKQ